jgi:YegS/Rv2252/BmrU family lipid kinase
VNNEVKKVLFIINKFSGTGYSFTMESVIREACNHRKVTCSLEFTEGASHATTLAARAVDDDFDLVVAVGGDGTVNEVAQGLLHGQVPMGIIPKGSGNGLARHLGIPLQTQAALQSLFTGETIDMDTFRVNGKLSLNVSGIGFDGLIANLFGTDTRRGLQGYGRLVLNEFRRFSEFRARLSTPEGASEKCAFVIAIANSSQYGNNARIAPAASVSDGILNLSILKKIPPYRVDLVYQLFSGTIDRSAYCEVVPFQEATIELSTPTYYHIDGEACGKAERFEIRLSAASLKVIAPQVGK